MEQLFYESIQSLNPENKGWKIQRPPDSEEYFLANFNIQVGFDEEKLSAIWSNDPADFGFTWDELVAKNQELLDYEPMRLLKVERDRLLVETDWMSLPDSPEMKEDWKTYRQELRDLPSTQSPSMDEGGVGIINVIWPTPPE